MPATVCTTQQCINTNTLSVHLIYTETLVANITIPEQTIEKMQTPVGAFKFVWPVG